MLRPKWEDNLARLRHELVHCLLISHFIDLPPWIDEGLAQLGEDGPPYDQLSARRRQELRRIVDGPEPDYSELIALPVGSALSRDQYRQSLTLTWLLLADSAHGPAALRKYLAAACSGPGAAADFQRCFGLEPASLPRWLRSRRPEDGP